MHKSFSCLQMCVCVCVCVWLVSLLAFGASLPVEAATMPVSSIAAGEIIAINGRQFVKIRSDQAKGAQFLAITPLSYCQEKGSSGTMQSWTQASCDGLATPTGTGFTQGPCLADSRDGKVYEIRKFADGNCWMVDNLAYGGGSDGISDYCVGKNSIRVGNSPASVAAVATNGLNPPDGSRNTLVGDCRNPAVAGGDGNNTFCLIGEGAGKCGYWYNWAATIQNASGWRGNDFQPSQPAQGICPAGWHVPSGNHAEEYATLHNAVGNSGTGFWQSGMAWKGILAGVAQADSNAYTGQGIRADFWTSSQHSTLVPYRFFINAERIAYAVADGGKEIAASVRCLKDYSCPANCGSCTSSSKCTACASGYLLSGGSCVPTGTVANCTAYSAPNVCTACALGYTFSGGACVVCDVANCRTCSSPNYCSSCEYDYIAAGGHCDYNGLDGDGPE